MPHMNPQPGEPWSSPAGMARVESVPTFRDAGKVVRARWETGPGVPTLTELPLADFLDVFERVTP